jgi:hypothetical protein
MIGPAAASSRARFWLGAAGVAAAAVAVAADSRTIGWAAAVILALAFLGRLAAARGDRSPGGGDA